MMTRQRKRNATRAARHALTLSSFEATLAKVEREAFARPDATLQGVVILARAFAARLRDDAAIS